LFDVKVVVVGAGTMGSEFAYVSPASVNKLVVLNQDKSLLAPG